MNLLCYITAANASQASHISSALLRHKFASCVMTTPINSQYVWKGKVEKSKEILMIVKTNSKRYLALEKLVKNMHSYEVPCIVATPITKGNKEYLAWSAKALR